MLALGVIGHAANTLVVSAPAFLIPLLHAQGVSLTLAGVLAAAPTFGLVLALIAWGAVTDRIGERIVMVAGLALTMLAAIGAYAAGGNPVLLGVAFFAAGITSGSTNAASGRVVVGWFPKHQRGLAMGIRQMSQPLGVTIAAVTVPAIAEAHGIRAALILPIVLCGVLAIACAFGIRNPPRPPRSDAVAVANPYRGSWFLFRIHAVSALLVVPQYTLSTFGLVWLTGSLHWSALAAGILVGASQFVGAVGRIAVGLWSDRVGSRVRPLRIVALSAVAVMLLLAIVDWTHLAAGAVFLVIATTVTVADNGLSFTSVAEAAGPYWSGRALGAQNTGQYLAATAVGPGVGALIGLLGFAGSFLVVALLPLGALPLVPHEDREHPHV
jgi:MFS family permease